MHLLSPRGPRPVAGVTLHTLKVLPAPATVRVLVLALSVRLAVRRGAWDAVQSHERTLSQDIYRAGEGCHRAYLTAMGPRQHRRAGYHRLLLALERRVFTRTPEIVAISRRGAEEIAKLYGVPPARLSVIYNGVDLERYHPDNRARFRAAARGEARLAPEGWVVLFAGSGFERKGLATAIEAFARLDERGANLVVVGKGDQGLGPRPDIERWYAAADALALPTRYEPFGNVHLEALASGLPVVTTTAAGGAEVVTPACGAAVEPGDPVALAAALMRVRALDPARAAAAARTAAEPFTYERQVAEFERIYRRLPESRAGFSLRNR